MPKTLDDIDEDDDYVPSSQNRQATIAAAPKAQPKPSPSSNATDDFFGTFGAPAPTKAASIPAHTTSSHVAPTAQKANKGGDIFDEFFGSGKTESQTSPNSTAAAATRPPSDNNFLDFESRPQITKHVTSDPQQYLEMATGGGTRLRPKSTLGGGNTTAVGNIVAGRQIGSGADNGSAHILGNPILLARMTHYEVLGVTELKAEAEEIHKAYKKKCLTLHPDRVVGRTQTEAEKTYFKAVVKAYEVLGDDAHRAEYDEELKEYRSSGGVGPPPSQQQAALQQEGSGASPNGQPQQQNQGGWDFLDDNGNNGLGDFAPPPQRASPPPASTTGKTSAVDDFFGAPSGQTNKGSAPKSGGGPMDWGNFSSSSQASGHSGTNPKSHMATGTAPTSLFAGKAQNPTIDDLFS